MINERKRRMESKRRRRFERDTQWAKRREKYRETESPHLDASSASSTIPSNLLLYSINDGRVEETKSASTAKAAVHSYVYTNIGSVCIDKVEKDKIGRKEDELTYFPDHFTLSDDVAFYILGCQTCCQPHHCSKSNCYTTVPPPLHYSTL